MKHRFFQIYIMLCVLAFAYAAYKFIWALGNSELAAVPLVLLGFPWTLVLVPLATHIHGPINAWIMLAGLVGSLGLNAWLLYRKKETVE